MEQYVFWKKLGGKWKEDKQWKKTFNNSEGKKAVRTVSFSPNGQFVAAGSDDKTVKNLGTEWRTINQPDCIKRA